MTVSDSDCRADDESPSSAPQSPGQSPSLEPGQSDSLARDARGRFGSGNKFSRGRPKQSLTRELSRITDVPTIARALHDLATDRDAPVRERLKAIEIIFDRLEGRPVARSLVMRATARTLLPAGFFALNPSQRERVLTEVRERALAGALALPEGDDDGEA